MSIHNDSDLSAIPGLGPVRRAALEQAGITRLGMLLGMELADLAAIRGIGLWQARRIQEYLRHQGLTPSADGQPALVLVVQEPDTQAAEHVTRELAEMERERSLEDEESSLLEQAAPAAKVRSGRKAKADDKQRSPAPESSAETSAAAGSADETKRKGRNGKKGRRSEATADAAAAPEVPEADEGGSDEGSMHRL
jgi:hypothetical protein